MIQPMECVHTESRKTLAENAWFGIGGLIAIGAVSLSVVFVVARWLQFRGLARYIDSTPWIELSVEWTFSLSGLIYLILCVAPFAGRAPGAVRIAISLLLAVGALLILAIEVPACWSYWTDLAQWTGPRRLTNAATLLLFGGTFGLCLAFAAWLAWPWPARP